MFACLIVLSERSGASCEPLHAVGALWKLAADMFLNSTPAEVALCAVRSDQNATSDLHRLYCILMFPLEIQSTYQLRLRRVIKCHPEFNTASARTESAAFLDAPWHGYVGPGTPQTMQIAGFLKALYHLLIPIRESLRSLGTLMYIIVTNIEYTKIIKSSKLEK